MLGYDIPKYLPVLFMMLCFLFLFDFFRKLLKWLGFTIYEFSVDANCSVTEEGRRILAEEERVFLDELREKETKKRVSAISDASLGSRLIDV